MLFEDIVSFMDVLDFDEELVDSRLESLMKRSTFTNQHLFNILHLLKYKYLINLKESDECQNDAEFEFICKLICKAGEGNIDVICKILNVILLLNPSTLVVNSQHLLQQILCFDILTLETNDYYSRNNLLFHLKLCNSVLDAILSMKEKLNLPYLEVPIQNILFCEKEDIKKIFLTMTVKKFFKSVTGYNILDKIWECIKKFESDPFTSLNVLCALSNYFLPLPDSNSLGAYESTLINHTEFWELVVSGLSSNDTALRKLATYSIKRALDCLAFLKNNVEISSTLVTFQWDKAKEKELRKTWDNFFILMDSLEEKQSNIVLPSLKLFECLRLQALSYCWVNCAFSIGLRHDNLQVKMGCIKHKLETDVINDNDTVILLESLNDINLYHKTHYCKDLKQKLQKLIRTSEIYAMIIKNVPHVNWSPVPFYHLCTVLAEIKITNLVQNIGNDQLSKILIDVLSIPCNNIAIRKAVHIKIANIITENCKELHWRSHVLLFSHLNIDIKVNWISHERYNSDQLSKYTKFIREELVIDTFAFCLFVEGTKWSLSNIDFLILYLSGHNDHHQIFMQLLIGKVVEIAFFTNEKNTVDIDKFKYISDIYFILTFLKCVNDTSKYKIITDNIIKDSLNIIEYVLNALSDTNIRNNEEMALIIQNMDVIFKYMNDSDAYENIYSYIVQILLISSDITMKKFFGVSLLNTLLNSTRESTTKNIKIDVCGFIDILQKVDKFHTENEECCGRSVNDFTSKACELVHTLLENKNSYQINSVVCFIRYMLESGGYGCLKWILKIVKIILPKALSDTKTFNVEHFLNAAWNELETIKSHKEYVESMQCFINIITNEEIMKHPMFNNLVVLYCSRIIGHSSAKCLPLYYLVREMDRSTFKYSHMVYIFCDILLTVPSLRKDQRIIQDVEVEILNSENTRFRYEQIGVLTHFHIQCESALILCQLDCEILDAIVSIIMKKIDNILKNKQRYHDNSSLHRVTEVGMQHLLFILLRHRSTNIKNITTWCIELLGKLPHQPSVRLYLEMYIALYLYIKDDAINENDIKSLTNVPIVSQFRILYWVITRKIKTKSCKKREYELVMDYLLENTMGPTYSVRLHAQYLAYQLNKCNEVYGHLECNAYSKTISIVEKTINEATRVMDKSLQKILDDPFLDKFDIIDITPCLIYTYPIYKNGITIDKLHAVNSFQSMNKCLQESAPDKFLTEWLQSGNINQIEIKYNVSEKNEMNFEEESEFGTIQKKYIPWKSMTDIDVVEAERKASQSELIVVASLIDKLPNLGGMARTGEVFGVHTYVVDSLRHLQDKQFQGLSMSAEKWVNIIEVRPGAPLLDYLTSKRDEGFCLVAAEQTSTSVSLQTFKFPKKTVLLLGNEKDGVPCNLLPVMDHCIEIPQQGVVRSLNVHVTAAIFIWQYSSQNVL
ncbi:uncharacterized protein LOC126967945 isoform X2 [Leptidea sinapis]|nr:uncharacterized protein LOC126967945 isoform X2 [Leptidea sinapis]